jgi:MFS family permease
VSGAESSPSARPPRSAWLTRNVAALATVSLLQDASSEIIYPLLPLYLTVTLGAPVVVVGAVEGIAEGVAALTKYWAGRRSDVGPRRPWIGAGYGLAAVGKIVVAAAVVWPLVLLGRAIDRFGKGIRGAPRDALLAEAAPPEYRGRVFGFHRAADTTGAVVGPLVAIALLAAFDDRIRPILLIAIVPSALSALAVLLVREPGRGGPAISPQPATAPSTTDRPRLPAQLRRVLVLLGLFSLINLPDALLLLRAAELGLGTAEVVAAYVLFNIVYAALAIPAGALSDRLPHRVIMAAGLVCFAVTYGGMALATEPWAVWPLMALYGGFAACTDGVGKAWVSSLVPRGQLGRAHGTYQATLSLGVLAAGIWGGAAWSGTGRIPLAIAASGALVIALALLVSRPGR